MAKFAFTQQINYATLKLNDFLGVDFQNDASEVSLSRSPDALNVVASNNSTIEKRPGYSILNTFIGGAKVNGIHVRDEITISSSLRPNYTTTLPAIYVHVGTQLWRFQGTFAWRMSPFPLGNEGTTFPDYPTNYCVLSDEPSMFVETAFGFTIFSGGQILKLQGYSFNMEFYYIFFNNILTGSIGAVFNVSYTPTTVIARTPTGGGKSYEAINALQPKRKNSFLGTATATTYQLDATLIDAIVADAGGEFNSETGRVTALILQSSGAYNSIAEGTGLTVNRTTGLVTFSVAPNVSPIIGQDNIIIQFFKAKISEGDPAYIIARTKVFALFGMNGSDDYVFMGNSYGYANRDYRGRTSDFYFPDTGYTKFGTIQSVIIGYSRLGEHLVVHKTSDSEEKTIYLRSATLDTDNEIIFPVKRGVSGISGMSLRTFQTLRGEPMFLSSQGVMALVSNDVTSVQSIQSRGYYIDNRLMTEANLSAAVSCIYDNKYMIFVNGKVYVCDPRRKYSEKDAFSESYQYEWYYWSGIDAKQVFEYKGTLYFGTSDGKLCKMRKKGEANAYYDNDFAISAYWTTPVLFMGDVTVKKSLKNLWIRMEQYSKSGIKVFYRCRGQVTLAKEIAFDTISFENIDFNRLTFETDVDAEIIVTNRVERQFSSIQFKFQNDKAENIGLIEVVAKYRANSAFKGG